MHSETPLYPPPIAARMLALVLLGGPGSGNFGHAGRPGFVGGSGPGFGSAPLTKGGAAKWRKAQLGKYQSDREFRAAVDAVTLLTQGSTHEIRAASVAAAEGDGALLRDYHKRILDEPLGGAAHPMGKYKNFFEGQDVEKADYITLREAGVALNKAIDTSPELDEPIFRGMPVAPRSAIGVGEKLDPISGSVVITDEKAYQAERARIQRESAYDMFREHPVNPFLAQIDSLKEGSDFNMPGVTSFTTDKFVATEFSRGEARGQGGRKGGTRTFSAVTLEVRGARSIAVAALSPWNQNEVLTRGKFIVVSSAKSISGPPYDYHIVLRPRR